MRCRGRLRSSGARRPSAGRINRSGGHSTITGPGEARLCSAVDRRARPCHPRAVLDRLLVSDEPSIRKAIQLNTVDSVLALSIAFLVNASIMVHNARAIGQMTRHGIEDTGGRAVDSNRRFLSQMPLTIASQFQYFEDLMVNLKENMTRDQYRKLLADYLNRFLEVAEKN